MLRPRDPKKLARIAEFEKQLKYELVLVETGDWEKVIVVRDYYQLFTQSGIEPYVWIVVTAEGKVRHVIRRENNRLIQFHDWDYHKNPTERIDCCICNPDRRGKDRSPAEVAG